ncbi:hypothetical protein ACWC0A_36980 [Streptomyces scopuliridis]
MRGDRVPQRVPVAELLVRHAQHTAEIGRPHCPVRGVVRRHIRGRALRVDRLVEHARLARPGEPVGQHGAKVGEPLGLPGDQARAEADGLPRAVDRLRQHLQLAGHPEPVVQHDGEDPERTRVVTLPGGGLGGTASDVDRVYDVGQVSGRVEQRVQVDDEVAHELDPQRMARRCTRDRLPLDDDGLRERGVVPERFTAGGQRRGEVVQPHAAAGVPGGGRRRHRAPELDRPLEQGRVSGLLELGGVPAARFGFGVGAFPAAGRFRALTGERGPVSFRGRQLDEVLRVPRIGDRGVGHQRLPDPEQFGQIIPRSASLVVVVEKVREVLQPVEHVGRPGRRELHRSPRGVDGFLHDTGLPGVMGPVVQDDGEEVQAPRGEHVIGGALDGGPRVLDGFRQGGRGPSSR